MKRPILFACTALVLAACASGADVAREEDAAADSAKAGTLQDAPPQAEGQPKDAQP